jgi:hypothetical protein
MLRDRLVIGAAIVVLCLAGGAFAAQTVLAGRDPTTIHAVGSLPDRISVCGRTWTKDVRLHEVTLEQASALREGGDAVVVATGPFAPCPIRSDPCTAVTGTGMCETVVFVRVGKDAYIAYALSGGP